MSRSGTQKGRGRGKRPKKDYSLKPRSADPLVGSILIQAWICPEAFRKRARVLWEKEHRLFTIAQVFDELKEYCLLRDVSPELHTSYPPRSHTVETTLQYILSVRIDDDETIRNRLERQCWRLGLHTAELKEAYLPNERALIAERRRRI